MMGYGSLSYRIIMIKKKQMELEEWELNFKNYICNDFLKYLVYNDFLIFFIVLRLSALINSYVRYPLIFCVECGTIISDKDAEIL